MSKGRMRGELKLTAAEIAQLKRQHGSVPKKIESTQVYTQGDRADLRNAIDASRNAASRRWLDKRIAYLEEMKEMLINRRQYNPDVLAAIGILEVLLDIELSENTPDDLERKTKMMKAVTKYHLEELPSAIFPYDWQI